MQRNVGFRHRHDNDFKECLHRMLLGRGQVQNLVGIEPAVKAVRDHGLPLLEV